MAKKKKPAPPTLKSILEELDGAMRKGLGKKKRLSVKARAYLKDRYTKSVTKAMEQKADWTKERKRVLRVGKKLGAVARVLTDGKIVLTWAAEAAANAVVGDPRCGMGTGRWCPPGD